MPATRVVDVLAEVFRTFGFDTTVDAHPEGMSRTTHTVDLLADKGGMDVAITVLQDDAPPVDMELVEQHARMARDIGAFYGLIVTTGSATEAACSAARRHKQILWDRAALESVIGKAVLTEVLDPEADIPLAEVLAYGHATASEPMESEEHTASDPIDLGLPAPLDDAVTEEAGIMEGRGWILQSGRSKEPAARDRDPGWTAPVTDPDPVFKAPPREKPSLAQIAAHGGPDRVPRGRGIDPRTFNPPEGALLAPAVSKEHAAQAARQRIYTIDHTHLRYHPKRVYRWSVECFVEGSVQTKTLSGTRLVDLATRDIEHPDDWVPSRSLREGTFDVPVEHKPVRLEADRARELVLDSVLQETARDIIVEDHDPGGDILVTQKKRVRAHRDDVQVADEGLHWCPVWCFTGVNGEIEIDALTGGLRSETLRNTTSNTMVL